MLKAHIVLMKELRAQRDSVADHRFHPYLPGIRVRISVLIFYYQYFLMAASKTHGNSLARDRIQGTAVAMLDPVTHCTRLGIEHTPPQKLSHCSQILFFFFFFFFQYFFPRITISFYFYLFIDFFVFFPFLRPLLRHVEVPRLGV